MKAVFKRTPPEWNQVGIALQSYRTLAEHGLDILISAKPLWQTLTMIVIVEHEDDALIEDVVDGYGNSGTSLGLDIFTNANMGIFTRMHHIRKDQR